ncbi:hypothetical protein ABT299_43740 [Spirillospora sp. NPDC000708]|uniref:Uncharacterized protein n=1 Tax=Actinomadura physcomitrii TaxID=2650748 RepID=A0A6I4M9T8_9ACTN|nr:hypothetical protein [Actinomadura physcomitrii]MWA02988.1 hypothetical protein [Actinomadura physcomitrii]
MTKLLGGTGKYDRLHEARLTANENRAPPLTPPAADTARRRPPPQRSAVPASGSLPPGSGTAGMVEGQQESGGWDVGSSAGQ